MNEVQLAVPFAIIMHILILFATITSLHRTLLVQHSACLQVQLDSETQDANLAKSDGKDLL